jgi:uncharacterized protein DUF3616
MKQQIIIIGFGLLGICSLARGQEQNAIEIITYRGASDASAAVALNEDMFLIADDENNTLRVYKLRNESFPIASCDLNVFLQLSPDHPEADIEGATKVGDLVFWITSHGRNKDGKPRPNRYRFFATKVTVLGDRVEIRPWGKPYETLVHDLIMTKGMEHLGLKEAAGLYATELNKEVRQRLAPKREGLNIEGLCASADGKMLYIGFRNPRPMHKARLRPGAIVVPLRNPREVLSAGKKPIFGKPMIWDLKNLGIRSMEYAPAHQAYFIIAGTHNQKHNFFLYKWSGNETENPVPLRPIFSQQRDFTPEALIPMPHSEPLWVLTDDGSILMEVSSPSECEPGEYKDGKCPNKFLIDPRKKFFRGTWLIP